MMLEAESKGSVLLVEDHQDIAELVYDYMEGAGYELDYAPDGEVGGGRCPRSRPRNNPPQLWQT